MAINEILTGQKYRPQYPVQTRNQIEGRGKAAQQQPGATITRAHIARAAIRLKAAQMKQQQAHPAEGWPDRYVNSESGFEYQPHNDEELEALVSDGPARLLVKGGEGSGKSVFGVIKTLERLKRGCSGVMGSPDMPHFRRSLWPEFRRWCPWSMVVPRLRSMAAKDWEPYASFTLTFVNGAQLICGGFDEPTKWEGPNLNFAHYDEARRDKTPAMLKVLDGRVRIVGPGGIPPQLWFTTTPKKHWLFDYFGPLEEDDPLEAFKSMSRTITLVTAENIEHLDREYVARRSQSLSEAEVRVLMEAAWEDLTDAESFLPSMVLWDALEQDLPPLGNREPLVFALDAGVSNDSFACVGVGLHPRIVGERIVVPRIVMNWVPPKKGTLDFNAIEREIVAILRSTNAVHLTYDPYQLHQMASNIEALGVVGTVKPFGQQAERLSADKALLDSIMTRGIAHDGNALLRQHIQNADKLMNDARTQMRLVKRNDKDKIDLAVALSMATARILDPDVLSIEKNLELPVGLPVGLTVASSNR